MKDKPSIVTAAPAKQLRSNGWKKGQSGNPNGRQPTAKCIPDLLRKKGEEKVKPGHLKILQAKWHDNFVPSNLRDAMLHTAYIDAVDGDAIARNFVAERTEGKITEHLEVLDTTPREIIFREVRIESGQRVGTELIKRTINRKQLTEGEQK